MNDEIETNLEEESPEPVVVLKISIRGKIKGDSSVTDLDILRCLSAASDEYVKSKTDP